MPTAIEERGVLDEISEKGKPAPLADTRRCVVERTNPWNNGHKRPAWCKRQGPVIDFRAASSDAVTLRRLLRQARTTYRWESQPRRRP